MIAPDVTVEAGITYRVLDYWTRRGYVIPEYVTGRGSEIRSDRDPVSPGSGSSRHYSDAEVAVCVRMAVLVRAGFAVPEAAVIARDWLAAGTSERELTGGVTVRLRDAGFTLANIPIAILAAVAISLMPNVLVTAVGMVGLVGWLAFGRSWVRGAA